MPITCWDCSYLVPWSEPKCSSQRLRKDSLKKIFLTQIYLYLYKTTYNIFSDLEKASEDLKMNSFIGMTGMNKGLKKANKWERESSSNQRPVADKCWKREGLSKAESRTEVSEKKRMEMLIWWIEKQRYICKLVRCVLRQGEEMREDTLQESNIQQLKLICPDADYNLCFCCAF